MGGRVKLSDLLGSSNQGVDSFEPLPGSSLDLRVEETDSDVLDIEKALELEAEEQYLHPENVTNVDTVDKETFDDLSARNRFVQQLFADHPDQDFKDLSADFYGMFYKYDPKILEKVTENRILNKNLVEEMITLPEYEHLRHFTRGDQMSSVAALDAVKKVFEAVPEEVKDQQKDVQEQTEKLQKLLESPNVNPSSKAGKKIIRKQLQEVKESATALQKEINSNIDLIRREIRKALESATGESGEFQDAASAFGWGNEMGDLTSVPNEERIKLATALKQHNFLRTLAKYAGRFIHIAMKKQAEKTTYERQVIEGIEQGNDIPDVVPEEFVKLYDPRLELLFLKQFAEQDLQQYRLDAKTPKGKGPIACAIDCSGSMQGTPMTWAMAVALALMMIARKQRRDFAAVLFNTQLCAALDVRPGEAPDAKLVIDFFGYNANGGTSYEPPLQKYSDGIKERSSAGFASKESDLVFITDGFCDVREDCLRKFLETKKEFNFSVYSVMIGNRHSFGGNGLKVLNKFSDKVFNLEGTANFERNQGDVFDSAFSI